MNGMPKQTREYDETTPVLIVGGSLVGLSTALFLSWYGIPCLLVERHAGISPHPRAFNFNMRTMELFRSVGVEDAIRCKAPPDFQNSAILQAESLAGKELGWITQDTTGNTFSPVSGCIIGQDALEPVLRARAEALGADLRFQTEFVSFEQDAQGVTALLRDRTGGQARTVHARYLIAADGNRSAIRQHLGTRTYGPGSLGHQLSILFAADIHGALHGRRLVVCFVNNSQVRKGTSLVFARNGQGLALFTPYFPEKGERAEDFAGERGKALVRGAIGLPQLPVRMLHVTPWEVAAWAAACFQHGRVFLLGDAAHVTPPAGAFGANTGIADAYNLAWKLALVLQGHAHPALLATYSPERQPIARYTTEQSYLMFTRFSSAPSAHANSTPIIPYNAIAFGYRYAPATEATEEDGGWYEDPEQPSGRPGSHAAHVVLQYPDGQRCSTLDLFGRRCVLLTGEQGAPWQLATATLCQRHPLPLAVYRIGTDGDLLDVEGRFLSGYGIGPTGAVLVRPDGFVAWRAVSAVSCPESALDAALSSLLGYPVSAQTAAQLIQT